MKKKFLTTTVIFYLLAFISASVAVSYGKGIARSYGNETGVDSGSDGTAVAFGIIASSFIIVGSFFLYKYLTSEHNA